MEEFLPFVGIQLWAEEPKIAKIDKNRVSHSDDMTKQNDKLLAIAYKLTTKLTKTHISSPIALPFANN